MKDIRWNLLKNEKFKKTRGFFFDDLINSKLIKVLKNMKSIKLTAQEKKIEMDLIDGKYKSISNSEFKNIANAINKRKKDAVLNIRVNKEDLENIKKKAGKLGVRYQTFLSEIIHNVAS